LLEKDQKLQESVLSVHHASILTLAGTNAFKIIENHLGVATVSIMQHVVVQAPSQGVPEEFA
jgi:hypothetical protein